MLSHRGNVQTSKFWRKSKEKKRNFFRKFTMGIKGFDLGKKKNSKISHACVPLMGGGGDSVTQCGFGIKAQSARYQELIVLD
jgi:hypothetical protein